MAPNPAKRANQIAEKQLELAEQQEADRKKKEREEEQKKADARANATSVRTSANMAYSNNFQVSTDFTTGRDGSYSLLTAGGTPSAINSLLGSDQSTLG